MKGDKLTQYLNEFLLESKGKSGFLYEQASKLARMLRDDYANQEMPDDGLYFHIDDRKELLDLLKPHLPFRINVQTIDKPDYYIKKFDGDGNVIEIIYSYRNKNEVIKLKKPLDLFGYFLNKRNDESYWNLYYFTTFFLPFIKKETDEFSEYFIKLIDNLKNTGDELSRDDLKSRDDIDPNKPYKYCWDEDYYDDEGDLKTLRRCEYKLPGNKRLQVKSKEI